MPRPIREYPITFTEGLNTSITPIGSKLHPVIMKNCRLSQDDMGGGIKAINGYSEQVDLGDNVALESIHSARTSAGTRIVFVTGGTKAYFTVLDTFWGTLKTGLTSGKKFSMVTLGDFVHFFNGNDTPFKSTIAGSPTVSDIGATRLDLTGATATLSTTTTNIKGVVKYYLSEMTGTTEGALSEAFGETDAGAGGQIALDMSDSLLNQSLNGKTLNLYRTQANGYDPIFLTQLTGTTTTMYTDTTSDTTLSTDGWVPYLHGDQPPASSISAAVHLNRIFLLGNAPSSSSLSGLYFSDIANVESYWVTGLGNLILVYGDDGNLGSVLAIDNDRLIIFKTDNIYSLVGRTPDAFTLVPSTIADSQGRHLGTPSIRSLKWTPAGLAFYYSSKVYLLRGSRAVHISGPIDEELRKIRGRDETEGVVLGVNPQKSILMVSVPISQTSTNHYPNTTFLYNWDTQKWEGTIDKGFNGFLYHDNIDGDKELWALNSDDDANGKVYKLFDGTTADGGNWNTEFELSPFYAQSVTFTKRFKYLDVIYRTAANLSFTVGWYFDGDDSTIYTQAITDGASPANDIERRRIFIRGVGRSISIRVTNNVKDDGIWQILSMVAGVQHLHSYTT